MTEKILENWKQIEEVDITIPEEKMYSRADIIHAFTSGHNKAKNGLTHGDALIEYKKEQNL